MYDRPTLTELLGAARHHFETSILPVAKATNHRLYFQTLVAINVMKIVEREYQMRSSHLRAEWTRLKMLMGKGLPASETIDDLEAAIQEANIRLCKRIRAGEFDADYALFEHLKARSIEQLEVANPRFLQTIQAEQSGDRG